MHLSLTRWDLRINHENTLMHKCYFVLFEKLESACAGFNLLLKLLLSAIKPRLRRTRLKIRGLLADYKENQASVLTAKVTGSYGDEKIIVVAFLSQGNGSSWHEGLEKKKNSTKEHWDICLRGDIPVPSVLLTDNPLRLSVSNPNTDSYMIWYE